MRRALRRLLTTLLHAVAALPKLTLNMKVASEAGPACATPRSAFSRASNQAAAAAAESRAAGGAKRMLHQHIARIKADPDGMDDMDEAR